MAKEAWEIAQDKRIKAQAKGLQGMTDEQVDAVDVAFNSLENALHMIKEINDLYMSDIGKLEEAYYKLRNTFNKG